MVWVSTVLESGRLTEVCSVVVVRRVGSRCSTVVQPTVKPKPAEATMSKTQFVFFIWFGCYSWVSVVVVVFFSTTGGGTTGLLVTMTLETSSRLPTLV
jgi:hypothetical protein